MSGTGFRSATLTPGPALYLKRRLYEKAEKPLVRKLALP